MAIQIITTCKNCGQPIDQDDYLSDWFHTDRADTGGATDMHCDPAKPLTADNQATPGIQIKERKA